MTAPFTGEFETRELLEIPTADGIHSKHNLAMVSTSTATGQSGHGGNHHNGKRLRKLLKPDGRRVHVAASPEEHRRLQKTLSTTEPDEHFDVYIHGSPEHVSCYDASQMALL